MKIPKATDSGKGTSGTTSAASHGGEVNGSAPPLNDGSSPIRSRWTRDWHSMV